MKCIQCGTDLPEGATFCTACGTNQATAPPPAPYQPPIPEPVSKGAGLSTKTILYIASTLFVIFVGLVLFVWLYFFPPGVYVQDSFRKVHKDLVSQVQTSEAKINDGMLDTVPLNEKFDAFLYAPRASDKTIIEATVVWKEGDENVISGIVCCATNENNFLVFMVTGRNEYVIDQYDNQSWYRLTAFLKLPKNVKIERNVPYHMKMMIEGDTLSVYLNDVYLAKITDAVEHAGRVGIYTQGGKAGKSVISFDDFKAKKISLFQGD